ncbi:MAG: helix-turn-helix domain containing protein [Desulfarculales bacterium]|jgi:hypothetical protein|nr:helix-turn-helix domain containing protein [Desulfarculales bacterium]
MDVKDIIQRMMQATNAKNQEDLAVVLGVTAAAISKAISRGNIPNKWYAYLLNVRQINPEWLKTGSPVQLPIIGKAQDLLKNISSEDFWRCFNEIIADPIWRGWYQVELLKRFPDLKEQIYEAINK